jgi:hypothetical protein
MCRGPHRRARHAHQLRQEDPPHRLLLPQAGIPPRCVGMGSHRRRSPGCRFVHSRRSDIPIRPHPIPSLWSSSNRSDLTPIPLIPMLACWNEWIKPCCDSHSDPNNFLSVLSPCSLHAPGPGGSCCRGTLPWFSSLLVFSPRILADPCGPILPEQWPPLFSLKSLLDHAA